MRSIRQITLILTIILLFTAQLGAKTLRCSACGTVIDGRYYRTDKGEIFCMRDYEKQRLRCSKCRNPIESTYYKKDGKTYCPSCYDRVRLRCNMCHKVIEGQYFEKDHKNYCLKCRDKLLPVCCCCRQKIRGGKYYTFVDGLYACEKCAKNTKIPRCVECNCPINTAYSSPIPNYGDYLCQKHISGAVTDYRVAKSLFQEARRNVVSALGPVMALHCDKLELKLVNRQTLMREMDTNEAYIRGFCRSQARGFVGTGIKHTNHTIYILAGMSRSATLAAMSHELGHAWQFENHRNSSKADKRFREGFAEWVSYKTTAMLGDKKQLERIRENQMDDYRKGLESFLNYEKTHGVKETIKAGRTKDRL